MSRLFYDKPKQPKQDQRHTSGEEVEQLDNMMEEAFGEGDGIQDTSPAEPDEITSPKDDNKVKGYLEKISKLIPSEIIAGYLAMFGLVPLIGKIEIHDYVLWGVFALCLILTPVYLNGQAEKDQPKRAHLIVSSLAFVIWAYVTTGMTLIPDFYDAAIASIALVAFSLVSAVVPLNK